MAKGGIIGIGIVLLIIAIIGYNFPITFTIADTTISPTMPQMVAFCDSGIGQFSQMSPQVVMVCSESNNLLMGTYGSGLLGIILIIVGSVLKGKKKDEPKYEEDSLEKLEERYSKGELTQGEFESKKSNIAPKKDEPKQVDKSIEILRERYAKGEITKEEFDKMKKDLENS